MPGVKGKSGRKPLKFDLKDIQKISALHPTDEELAAYLECSVDTITNYKKNDPAFLKAYNGGRGKGKLSLRRKQMSTALEGNTTMLVWMGKQLLGQRDNPAEAMSEMLQAIYHGIPSHLVGSSHAEFLHDLRNNNFLHYWHKGGRGSLKSSSISLGLVDDLVRNKQGHAVVLRDVFGTIKDSAYSQIIWAIDQLELGDSFKAMKSPMEIIYKPTGQTIFFRGLDDAIKLKSIKTTFGYIRNIWFEELAEIDGMETVRSVLQSLMRGGEVFNVFYSYNPPRSRNNWVNVAVEDMLQREDAKVYHSSYLTVPRSWLGDPFIAEAEALKERNGRAYQHEYLGEITGTGGSVFDNVQTECISDDVIAGLQKINHGVDFGFAVDPFVWLKCGYSRIYDTLYLLDEFYQIKVHDDVAGNLIKTKKAAKEVHFCDSADPKGIDNLKREGVNAVGCKKFSGSREYGYKFLQRWSKIVIDPKRCPNAAREFAACEYERDKEGNFLAVIPKKNDHTIDAVRYALDREIDNTRPATSTLVSTR